MTAVWEPLRIQHRKVSTEDFARLTETFGPKLATSPDGRVRYTYVQGPIRNRDTDHE